MLCTIEQVQRMPGFLNTARYPVPWLNDLIGAADRTIKVYCKQNLELQAYTEYYSGKGQRDLVINEVPILISQTTIAAGSNGQSLPQATINVGSTASFNPGITQGSVDPSFVAPSLCIQTGTSTLASVTYTGTTPTSFTGCSGGTGTLTTGNRIWNPCIWFDPNGFGGQSATGFADTALMSLGNQFMVVGGRGNNARSKSGLLRKLGGGGQGFIGYYPESMYGGKLGAYRLPTWFAGDMNIKVAYNAGYSGKEAFDLANACAQLVAGVARTMAMGGNLSSESLGDYSYNMLVAGDNPEMEDLRRKLAPYREASFGYGG